MTARAGTVTKICVSMQSTLLGRTNTAKCKPHEALSTMRHTQNRGRVPLTCAIDDWMPEVTTASAPAADEACSTAGRISMATPRAGRGLMRAATHMDRSNGLSAGGMSPRSPASAEAVSHAQPHIICHRKHTRRCARRCGTQEELERGGEARASERWNRAYSRMTRAMWPGLRSNPFLTTRSHQVSTSGPSAGVLACIRVCARMHPCVCAQVRMLPSPVVILWVRLPRHL